VLALAKPSSGEVKGVIALSLSAAGEALRKPFPDLPGDAGSVRQAVACRWIDDDRLLVLASTSRGPFGAIWLTSDLVVTGWLALENGKDPDLNPWAIAEIAPDQFVMVGMQQLRPVALRFDRRRGERLALPWPDAPQAQPWPDGPQAALMDVSADHRGGFAVCGMEARRQGGSVPTSEVVVATFDETGAVRAEVRLTGKNCRLLPSRQDQIRVLHDDGAPGHRTLVLTTLDGALETVSDEPLATPFVSEWKIAAFELDQRLFFVSAWFAWETLEIRGNSLRESIDLDVKAGGVIDLLPGPSRVYLISQTSAKGPTGSPSPFGLRVDAFDIDSPALP
jgi:hypothetical protein